MTKLAQQRFVDFYREAPRIDAYHGRTITTAPGKTLSRSPDGAQCNPSYELICATDQVVDIGGCASTEALSLCSSFRI